MIRVFVFVFIAAGSIFAPAFTDEVIFFKYLNKDKYYMYMKSEDDHYSDGSIRSSIANQLMWGCFSLDRIAKDYYNMETYDEINFFGFKFIQYTFTPVQKDRFKHILWTDENNNIVKIEVYDNYGALMFAFSDFDFIHGERKLHKDMRNTEDRGGRKARQGNYRFKNSDEFFKGFRHFHTKVFNESSIDLAFEDGLNKVSVFIKKAGKNMQPVSSVIYGNYLLSRTVNNMEYTVYGTVPFSMMEEFINILSEYMDSVADLAKAGEAITGAIYGGGIKEELNQ